MLRLDKNRTQGRTNRPLHSHRSCAGRRGLLLALLIATTILTACGGSGSSASGGSENTATLSGNWQFTLAPPVDGSFLGGVQGGFLLQTSNSVKGSAAYAVSLPGFLIPCNSGSAGITGTISGQAVTLTAAAGTQTFTFSGTLSFDGSTMVGTYTTPTAGTSGDGATCGTIQTVPIQWSATLVPPITGAILGNIHSVGGVAGLSNQDFRVSGSLIQAENTGSSTATVTGNLDFGNSDYPCFNTVSDTASVYGQISGNIVTLQVVGPNQSILGQIGEPTGSNGTTGLNLVTFDSAGGGYILHGIGPSYLMATSVCPGSLGNIDTAGDYGNLCLALQSASGTPNTCQQPITLTPAALTFPSQIAGSTSTQTITLANASGTTLSGLVLTLANIPASAANFAETDACGLEGVPSQGAPFYLASGQSCAVTIAFTPQCVTQCASALTATLTVASPVSADNDTVFAVPITGTGTSSSAGTSTSELDFRAEDRRRPASISNHTLLDIEPYAEID
jgi:hypothetical protein